MNLVEEWRIVISPMTDCNRNLLIDMHWGKAIAARVLIDIISMYSPCTRAGQQAKPNLSFLKVIKEAINTYKT